MDDPDNLLCRAERLENIVADSTPVDTVDESLGDIVIDVGFQQRLADRLHPLADVGFGQPAAIQERQRVLQVVGDAFEHTGSIRLQRS